MKPAAEPWFHNAIVDGVMLLHSLCLDGRPAAEVVTLTATGWIEVLWRGGAWQRGDASRIEAAFFSLSRVVDKWPAPRLLLDHLPVPAPVLALPQAVPPLSPERRAELVALRRRLADQLSTPQVRAVRPSTFDGGGCDAAVPAGNMPDAPKAAADRAGCATS